MPRNRSRSGPFTLRKQWKEEEKEKAIVVVRKEMRTSRASERFKIRAQHCKITPTKAHLHRKEQQLYKKKNCPKRFIRRKIG
jgi:hypothetical protein